MQRRVVFQRRAQRELVELYDYIAERGGALRAAKFVAEIRTYCLGFAEFAERGTRRDDLAPDVRLVGWRRRVSIVFRVDAETVKSIGIFYRGRNIGPEVIEEE